MSQNLDTSTEDSAPTADHSGNGSTPPSTDTDSRLATPHRRWPWFLVGAAVGVGGFDAVDALTGSAEPDDPAVQEVVDLSTVQVSTQDLVEEVEWSGTLSSGLVVEIPAPGSGVITSGVAEGDVVERGDVIADLDGEPVVAFLGDVPMWRALSSDMEGDDVLQLETNLVALGFDPDGEVVVDDVFDTATTDMVELWEESLGLEATGEVPVERVAVIPGTAEVAAAPAVGETAQPGQPLAQLDLPAAQIDVVGSVRDDESAGEVTAIAPADTPIEHGTVLARVDGTRVVAVVDQSAEFDVVFATFEAGDVETIEETLLYLGHDPNEKMTVDGDVDVYTTRAVTRWQESVGLAATGSISPSDYVLVPEAAGAAYAVESVFVEEGDLLVGGTVMMQLGTPTLTVAADIAVREIDEFAVGDTVVVEQLDESTFEAVVSEIAEIAEVANEADGQDGAATITVTFEVVAEPEEFTSGAVVVITESSRVDGAMVVPTRALITLAEGGFAVEKEIADGSTELVGVELGTFDEGVVEIAAVTAGTLDVGDAVVVPS